MAVINEQPEDAAMIGLVRRLFGERAATALLAPFTLGTEKKLRAATSDVLPDLTITRHEGLARFESLEAWVHTDIRGWTLDDLIDDAQFIELMKHARTDLADFVTSNDTVQFAAPALIATTTEARFT